MATQWQYAMQRISFADATTLPRDLGQLNELGKEGWEAVAWIPAVEGEPRNQGQVLLKKRA